MKRKIVQTNIIFFVSYEDGILTIMEASAEQIVVQKPIGMSSEQNYNISSVRFFFLINIINNDL